MMKKDEVNGKTSTVKKRVKSEKTGKLRDSSYGENENFKGWNERADENMEYFAGNFCPGLCK